MSEKNALFPKRRDEDRPKSVFGINIISLTDLIGILLTFFILMYSLREPPQPPVEQDAAQGVAPVVAQQDYKAEGVLTKTIPGLDLNYIAALLRQAQLRDPRLADIAIETQPYALVMVMDNASAADIRYALDKISLYRRTVAVFGPESVLNGLMDDRRLNGNIRYYPRADNSAVRILIH